MTKYTITMQFGSEADRKDVEEWAKLLMEAAPDGADLTVRSEPLTLNAEDVTEEFYGHEVQFYTHDGRDIKGTLNKTFQAGGKHNESVVLVVDEVAWLLNFGVVTITDW